VPRFAVVGYYFLTLFVFCHRVFLVKLALFLIFYHIFLTKSRL
jgi:hypothetical protein